MTSSLFAYGSLMFPDVYEAVTRCARVGRPARLAGFERFRVLEASYPGIRRREGATTEGIVYTGLTPAEVEALDVFEGDYYSRERVAVELLDAEETLEVETYVIRDHHAHVLSREAWDPGRFEREHKRVFLREYTGFRWLGGADRDPYR